MQGAQVSIPTVHLAEDFTAVVTGAQSGLGFEVCKYLALLGGRVVLAGLNETKARAAIHRIQADVMEMRESVMEMEKEDDGAAEYDTISGPSPSERTSVIDAPLKLEFMRLDLASLDSVKHFAAQFIEKGYPLHLLICNDAVINVPKSQTVDGLEMHFQYNYLGHFLLTLLLLPTMLRHGEDARIILTSSTTHTSGHFELKNIQAQIKNSYDSKKFFANSQLYLIMLMYSLHLRLQDTNVSVFSVHNGHIDTLLKKHKDDLTTWGGIYSIGRQLGKIGKDTSKSVSNCLSVAITPALRSLRNSFFVKGLPMSTSPVSKDGKIQEILWRYSIELIKDHITQEDVKHLKITDDQMEDIGIDGY